MIQEGVRGDLPPKPRSFVEHELLGKPEAHDVYPRPFDDALTRSAEMAELGRRECAGIKPTVRRSLAAGQVRIVQNVRPHRDRSRSLRVSECDADRIVA